ncbi:MAG: TfpX/TfpZ family type IV pilin accessory protein [Pseudomonadota bacterium]|uniref:Type IV pilin accessory protein n=1 Tax=Acinetobacter bereziniae TaxID=106648 RepID=A0A8I1DJR6_ACIBZ|nr:TfpX/TfpZ family type IV pilin accessory protein [Acinetobacter bereziniae]MEC8123814.1 TfpX/TfpZ family type IV pilin accessory protein [Pseudomonadota bacterium]QQC85127.1 type IV pilin accessory protein [Acinetobacter bereziniae]UUN98280.1 type IV pilin accessory protein [Acinetobacter bereziniae]
MPKRLIFFLSHLMVSILLALLLSWLVFFIWYPAPLADALGVKHLFLILIAIDIIIGPLLSLFVYKEHKKGLKFDLMVVICIQLFAFVYGFYTIVNGRPVWLVYDTYVFHLVKNSDIEPSHIDAALPQFQKPGWLKPMFVNLDSSILKNNPVPQGTVVINHPMFFTDFSNAKRQIKSVSSPISLLEKYNDKQIVDATLQKYSSADAWLGLSAPAKDMVVLINKEKGEVVKIVDLRPWK